MALYHFVTELQVDAPPEQVWAVLEDPATWPSWWRWLRSVQVLAPEGNGGEGGRYRFGFRTALPYTLSFDSHTVRMVRPTVWESRATGELEGLGLWEVTPRGGGSHIRHTWIVATTKRWMNVLAPIGRPAFSWNHAIMMRDFATGLAGRLETRLAWVRDRAVKPSDADFGRRPAPVQP